MISTGEAVHANNAVYMLASGRHGTLYIGVTSDLLKRVQEHREGARPGFKSRCGVKRLVWFRRCYTVVEAIGWEKRLKKYRREWKINLIEADNPSWDDLFPQIV